MNLPIGSTTAVNPDAKWRSKDVKGMPSRHIEMFRQEKEAQDFSDLSGHGLEFVAFESSTVPLVVKSDGNFGNFIVYPY